MQIADDIQRRISTGELPIGARLPGEDDLAREYRVATHTARRAVRELRDRGLAATLPSKGTFIIERPAGDPPGDSGPE